MPRTSFNSPRLIRLLADLAIEDGADSPQSKASFAERLGHWLDLTDAIALSGALNANAERAPAAGAHASGRLAEDYARVRGALLESIAADGGGPPHKARARLPVPLPGASLEDTGFVPYLRYYLARQREMETAIAPLRAGARTALAARSPAHRRLAALDAVLDKALGERERNLLAGVPALLEKRFEQRRAAHRQTLAATPQADDPARWMQPGGWLATFCQDMQALLLAELELRLQPAAGLIEAAGQALARAGGAPSSAAGHGGGPSFSSEVSTQQ